MNDAPSAIDPLVAEGPLAPVETLRPAPSLQRVLLLDDPGPAMVDLESGDIRRYESGPPVSVPMVSNVFDLSRVRRLQLQILQDPRPSSVSQTLASLDVRSAGLIVDVRATPAGLLEVTSSGSLEQSTAGPLGSSPALVVVIEFDRTSVRVSARNADTLTSIRLDLEVGDGTAAALTVGGQSTRVTDTIGRRRTIPVLIELEHHSEPIDRVSRVLGRVRHVAGVMRDKAL